MNRKQFNLTTCLVMVCLFWGVSILGQNTWDGSTDTDWNTADNWSLGTVPIATDNVVIANEANQPNVSGTTALSANLTINSGATLTISSDGSLTIDGILTQNGAFIINSDASNSGSLIITGDASGNVTYNRYIPSNTNWYLASSPVGYIPTTETLITNNPTVATGTLNGNGANNRGIGFYSNFTSSWSYVWRRSRNNKNHPEVFPGQGFAVRLTSAGPFQMTGDLKNFEGNLADVLDEPVTATPGVDSFNLVGNPFTAYMNSKTYTAANSSKLQEKTVWVSEDGASYATHNDAAPIELAPGQGFFIKVTNTATGVDFSRSNQSHQSASADNFGKQASHATFELYLENNANKKSTKVFYIENKTTGFDNGYDSSLFEDSSSPFSLYTELVSSNQGEKLAIQTLPDANIESFVVPVGVKAVAHSEIIFSIVASSFDEHIKIYLEDRVANTFTRLDEVNSTYKVTPENNLDGVGRFYMHTTQAALSVDTNEWLSTVQIYKVNNTNLRITGLTPGEASVHLYNILGKQVLSTSFDAMGTQDIAMPTGLSKGIYLVKLETADGILHKKIILE